MTGKPELEIETIEHEEPLMIDFEAQGDAGYLWELAERPNQVYRRSFKQNPEGPSVSKREAIFAAGRLFNGNSKGIRYTQVY